MSNRLMPQAALYATMDRHNRTELGAAAMQVVTLMLQPQNRKQRRAVAAGVKAAVRKAKRK